MSEDICIECGHSIVDHQSEEGCGPCRKCDCGFYWDQEDEDLLDESMADLNDPVFLN